MVCNAIKYLKWMFPKYYITYNNLHIEDSYKIQSKRKIKEILKEIKKTATGRVFERSLNSLASEWIAHNRLYRLGIEKERTKDVDLNCPIKKIDEIMYCILGFKLW